MELRHQADELARRQTLEDALLLRHETYEARSLPVRPWILAEHAYRFPRRLGLPGEHPQHGGLAGAVRPSSAVTPTPTSKLTSETATLDPNHLETLSADTPGSRSLDGLQAPVAEPADAQAGEHGGEEAERDDAGRGLSTGPPSSGFSPKIRKERSAATSGKLSRSSSSGAPALSIAGSRTLAR